MSSLDINSLSINIGPHPSLAIGPLQVRTVTDGEVVIEGVLEVGYLHRGIEKIAERMSWLGFMPYTDRIDYLAAIHCNLAYALVVESLAALSVPLRAQHIRIVVCELNRIASHLLYLGNLGNLLGATTFLNFTLRDREKINNLFEMLCGARLTYNYIRIGGVAVDVTEGFIEKTYEFIDYLTLKLKEYDELLILNPIFQGRLKNVGKIALNKAINCGITGPNLRACGLAYDARKAFPYSNYHHLTFEIPVKEGQVADAYDRYWIRLQEIKQSMFLVKQVLDLIPAGDYETPLPRYFKVPVGEAYSSVESPRGLLGVYIQSAGNKSPSRVKIRAPSVCVLNLFPDILKGELLSDVPAIVGSFDVLVSEVDR